MKPRVGPAGPHSPRGAVAIPDASAVDTHVPVPHRLGALKVSGVPKVTFVEGCLHIAYKEHVLQYVTEEEPGDLLHQDMMFWIGC